MKKQTKIVAIGRLPQWVQDDLTAQYQLVMLNDSNLDLVFESLDSDVVALIPRGSTFIDHRFMDPAPNLKVIARTGVGFDTIDVSEASSRGIPVVYTPGAMSRAVAEHAVGLMISCFKDYRGWHRAVRDADWDARYHRLSRDLRGATLGIVGFGRIGKLVYHLLRNFEMRFLIDDPYLDPHDFESEPIRFVSLEDALPQSDVVTLHVPLTAETRALINSRNIDQFKEGAVLINTARGRVVENNSLVFDALERGRLAHFAADVLLAEPPDSSDPLLKHPRALLTPHVASRTPEAQQRVLETMLKEMKAVLEGRQPSLENVVNPEVFRD